MEILKFILFLIFFLYYPGRLLLLSTRIKWSKFEEFILSLSIGIVILILLAFILGWLKLRYLAFPILTGAALLSLWLQKPKLKLAKNLKTDWRLVFLLILATIYQSLVMIKSGTAYQGGLAFWGINGHDGLWHLTLMQELAQNFPGENPGYAGESLKNYHFFYDLLVAETYRLAKIPLIDLFFRFFTLLFAFLLNSLVYLFAKLWSGKKSVAYWSIFFVAFASSLGFLLPWLGIGSNNWETAFWAMQPASSLQNPQFVLSLIFICCGMIFLLRLEETNKNKWPLIFVASLFLGSIMEVKVYGGLVVLASLFLLALWQLSIKRTQFWGLFFLAFFLSLITYLPVSRATTNFLKWQPFWFIRTMIQAPDRVNWVNLELRRQTYAAYYDWSKVLIIDMTSLFLFFVGNLGTRILGLPIFFRKIFKLKTVDLFLILIFLAGVFPSMLFLQEYLAWNTIQFFYYSIFIFCFFAAFGTDLIFKKIKNRLGRSFILLLIIFLSIPSTLRTVSWHLGRIPTSVLDRWEKEALLFLKNSSRRQDLVLAYPYLPGIESKFFPPVPLSYYNAGYVSYFANRHLYLEDQTVAQIQGYGLEERLKKVRTFFNTTDAREASQFLKQNKVRFIYLVDDQRWQALLLDKPELIYKNQRVRIYQVKE